MDSPRVNHAWPTWLPSVMKWLDLWIRDDQLMWSPLNLAQLSIWSPTASLYSSWVFTVYMGGLLDGWKTSWNVGLKAWWLLIHALSGCQLHVKFLSIYSVTSPFQYFYQWLEGEIRIHLYQDCKWHQAWGLQSIHSHPGGPWQARGMNKAKPCTWEGLAFS